MRTTNSNSFQFSASDENGGSRELAVLQTRLVVDNDAYHSASTFVQVDTNRCGG